MARSKPKLVLLPALGCITRLQPGNRSVGDCHRRDTQPRHHAQPSGARGVPPGARMTSPHCLHAMRPCMRRRHLHRCASGCCAALCCATHPWLCRANVPCPAAAACLSQLSASLIPPWFSDAGSCRSDRPLHSHGAQPAPQRQRDCADTGGGAHRHTEPRRGEWAGEVGCGCFSAVC